MSEEGGEHYRRHQYETWDVIKDWDLGYFDGNAVKYLSRWKHKHATHEGRIADLQKARHYIDKLIEIETFHKKESDQDLSFANVPGAR